METDKKLLRIKNLVKSFPIKSKKSLFPKKVYINAVDNISLDIYEGEIVGILGESGCGKSSFGRTILQLYKQTSGTVVYNGCHVDSFNPLYHRKEIENLANNLYDAKNVIFGAKNSGDEFINNITRITGGLILSDNLSITASLLRQKHTLLAEYFRLKRRISNKSKVYTAELSRLKYLDRKLAELDEKISVEKCNIKNKQLFSEYEANLSDGINLSLLDDEEMRCLRRDLQIVFQDPYSSLNQRMSIGENISQGLLAFNIYKRNSKELRDYVMNVMERCDLPNYMIYRYPYQFSEGQRQRVSIARALAMKPKFIVCDGVVSSLDVSIQSQIINLLLDLKEKDKLTYLFISHNINVVKYISDRIGIMYLGSMVELCDSQELFNNPLHPYTKLLISSVLPINNQNSDFPLVENDAPSRLNLPNGCKFSNRCRYCTAICMTAVPEFKEVEKGHFIACHLYE